MDSHASFQIIKTFIEFKDPHSLIKYMMTIGLIKNFEDK